MRLCPGHRNLVEPRATEPKRRRQTDGPTSTVNSLPMTGPTLTRDFIHDLSLYLGNEQVTENLDTLGRRHSPPRVGESCSDDAV